MTFFLIDEVRDIALNASYEEIDCNTTSKVISFRKNSTRINVYYTAGTVGTCLNHPRKGKTQLFRREVSFEELESIFLNPRLHIGKGYYRKRASQWWKNIDTDGKVHFEPDSARRWRFVLAASGLSTSSREIDRVANLCKKLDSFYWDEGTVPKMTNVKYGCGLKSAVDIMLRSVMNDAVAECGTISAYRGVEKFRSGEISRDKIEENHFGRCCNIDVILEAFSDDIDALELKIRSFREDIRIELCQWILSRNQCGFYFYLRDSLELIQSEFYDRADRKSVV